MIDEKMEIAVTAAGMAGVAGLVLGLILGQALKSDTRTAEPKFNEHMIRWDYETSNGVVLYRGVYENTDYLFEATDTTRNGVVESLRNMVNA